MKRHFLKYCRSKSQIAQFLRFATVGAKISLIDVGGLYLLKLAFGMNIFLARLISFTLAMVAGYLLNRYFTFNGFAKGCFYRQLVKHLGVHAVGGAINLGVFAAVVALGEYWLEPGLLLSLVPMVGVWIGGVAGMTFNFYLSQIFVFQTDKEDPSDLAEPTSQPAKPPRTVGRCERQYALDALSQVDSRG